MSTLDLFCEVLPRFLSYTCLDLFKSKFELLIVFCLLLKLSSVMPMNVYFIEWFLLVYFNI